MHVVKWAWPALSRRVRDDERTLQTQMWVLCDFAAAGNRPVAAT